MNHCSHKACKPFAGQNVYSAGVPVLFCECKDLHTVLLQGAPTGLHLTWKPGGWTMWLHGREVASGGLHYQSGFAAQMAGARGVSRDGDQMALIGKVARKVLAAGTVAGVAA